MYTGYESSFSRKTVFDTKPEKFGYQRVHGGKRADLASHVCCALGVYLHARALRHTDHV